MHIAKFRAWDKREKIWRNDVFISMSGHPHILRSPDGLSEAINSFYKKKGDVLGGNYSEFDATDWYGVENVDIQLWTGLKDKDGEEVYEGDILNLNNLRDGPLRHRWKVIWEETYFGIESIVGPGEEVGLPFTESSPFYKSIKVVGNIHQNPELLNHDTNSL